MTLSSPPDLVIEKRVTPERAPSSDGIATEGAQGVSPCPVASGLGSYRITDRNPQKRPFSKRGLIQEFRNYLKTTSQCTFINHGLEWDDDNPPVPVRKEIGYIHRWTPIYRKAVIAKMYLLEKWYNDNPCDLTMGTFTTYQDGAYSERQVGKLTVLEAFATLKKSWNLIRMYLRYYYPEISFVYMYEPHKTGYPHLHVLFFGNLPDEIQEKIKRLWSEKYKAGSYEHGVKFKKKDDIKSVRNYVIKYLAKILHSTGDDWTDGELFFNAVIWKQGYFRVVIAQIHADKIP